MKALIVLIISGFLMVSCNKWKTDRELIIDQKYIGELNPVNNSSVNGSVSLHFMGNLAIVTLSLKGLDPDQQCSWGIYGRKGEGALCPSMENDKNEDGWIDFVEASDIWGWKILSSESDIISNKNGETTYEKKVVLGRYGTLSSSDIKAIGSLTFVILGVDTEVGYLSSFPAACGQLQESER